MSLSKKQEVYEQIGREIVNNFPRYRDDIIKRHIDEAKTSGIVLKDPKPKRRKAAPTIDMFPDEPSSRKEDK